MLWKGSGQEEGGEEAPAAQEAARRAAGERPDIDVSWPQGPHGCREGDRSAVGWVPTTGEPSCPHQLALHGMERCCPCGSGAWANSSQPWHHVSIKTDIGIPS